MDQTGQKRRPIVWFSVTVALFATVIAVAVVPTALAQGSQSSS